MCKNRLLHVRPDKKILSPSNGQRHFLVKFGNGSCKIKIKRNSGSRPLRALIFIPFPSGNGDLCNSPG